MRTASWAAERIPAGTALMMSRVMTRCCVTFWTSTVGVSPDTVIVSCSDPTRRSALTVAVKDAVNSMPSRFTALKPVSVNVTV